MDGKLIITSNTYIAAPKDSMAATQFCRLVHAKFGILPQCDNADEATIRIEKTKMEPEKFHLTVQNGKATVTAGDDKGALYGMQTLFRLLRQEGDAVCAPQTDMVQMPYKEIRGAHLMPPAPDALEEFKRVLDVLCLLKYNTIVIEVGGSMEYTRHPRINKVWKNFCDILQHQFPHGPQNMQWAYKYWKDCPHTGNADGKVLSKLQMREIVEYAKKLGMQVIPEIQALSHVYYLTLAYREIAEDRNDSFPDTYCPLDEESYALYFDVAEEVIEVFQPTLVSIGHDEIRALGECEKCREKSGQELLSYEINRLYDFYKKKNIRICMWAEKLMEPTQFARRGLGGGGVDRTDEYGRRWTLPATHTAIDFIPKDILMIDWYHMLSPVSEREFVQRDMDVVYGNVHGQLFGNWENRGKSAKGAIVSTWCPPTEAALARDGILLNLAFTGEMLWRQDYTDADYDAFMDTAIETLADIRCVFRQEPEATLENAEILFRGHGATVFDGDAPFSAAADAGRFLRRCGKMGGTSLDAETVRIPTDTTAAELIFVSAYKKQEMFYPSYNYVAVPGFADGYYEGGYECVHLPRWDGAAFTVIYEDGTMELINMTYGRCSADLHMNRTRQIQTTAGKVNEIDMVDGDEDKNKEHCPIYTVENQWIFSIPYLAYPATQKEVTTYVYRWKNPHPNTKIIRIDGLHTTRDKTQGLLLYAVAYQK